MSRARRGRPRKLDIERQPNGQPSRKDHRKEMEHYVTIARARKEQITGSPDMPIDVLGIAHGRGYITDGQYAEGRKLERLFVRLYGAPRASGTAIFQNYVTPPEEQEAIANVTRMTDDDAKSQYARKVERMDEYGRKTRDMVINAVVYCRYPKSARDFNRLVIGLTALTNEWEVKKVIDEVRKAA